MSPRTLSKRELKEIGLEEDHIETVFSMQLEKAVRRFKYIAFLTPEEAKSASGLTKQDFVRATKYRSEAKSDSA